MVFQIAFAVSLLLLVIAMGYILKMHSAEKEWKKVLERIRLGQRSIKAFTKDKGILADINFLMNEIVEDYNKEIAALKKANEASRQILTSLSHDVRTPLASLNGYIDALRDGIVVDEEIPEYLNVASRKAADLKTLVDMLFDWFKLCSGEMQLAFSSYDINELSREILIDWLPILEKQRYEIEIDIADSELMLSVDKAAYKRIVDNIIQNAVTHSRGDKIKFSISQENKKVCVVISDNGWIADRQLPLLFDRLYKGDAARSGKGSGLGLAITKELVSVHKGQIIVNSSKETGTVFSVYLPM